MTTPSPPSPRAAAVRALAQAMRSTGWTGLDNGRLAALRRLDPAALNVPAFWETMNDNVVPDLGDWPPPALESRWALLIHAMALMAPDPHDGHVPVGAALAEADFSEPRLERLLRARGDGLHRPLIEMARFLRAKGKRIDWVWLAPMVLGDPEDEGTERARRAVARDYFRTLAGKTRRPDAA